MNKQSRPLRHEGRHAGGGVSLLLSGILERSPGDHVLQHVLSSVPLALGSLRLGAAHYLPAFLVGLVGFLVIGPYSYLAGAIALDFGGKHGSATSSGIIDGVGYLGGILAGGSMARISVRFGWSGAFLALAGTALLSSAAAAVFLISQRRREVYAYQR